MHWLTDEMHYKVVISHNQMLFHIFCLNTIQWFSGEKKNLYLDKNNSNRQRDIIVLPSCVTRATAVYFLHCFLLLCLLLRLPLYVLRCSVAKIATYWRDMRCSDKNLTADRWTWLARWFPGTPAHLLGQPVNERSGGSHPTPSPWEASPLRTSLSNRP